LALSAKSTTGAREILFWLIALLGGALLVWIAFRFDNAFHAWQREHVWHDITLLRRYVTRATDWPAHIALGAILAGIAWWKGNPKWSRIFLAMVAAAALAGVAAYSLKISTGRVRPSVIGGRYEPKQKIERVWGGPNWRQNFQSFPSGHTAVSTGFFAVLFFVSWRIGLLCLPVPLFVAFSRYFLGAHYLSDVVGAIVVGVLSAALISRLMLAPREEAMP
jgi:membrane-associated phospholipid phosphatase